ncbi:MAG: type I 3-dehydroquinate dehydratase [Candidatus Omnitrophica bacterium]|nr:type I 3-dehydroquinate dehydratase [Candidatus Omnitrophota bacterium]MCM8802534.1 type I 3-dehydroquinate dehydratase [Candidatus Omnitrophota bacterium]
MENLREKFIIVLTGDEEEKVLYETLNKVKYLELRIDLFLKTHTEDELIEWIKKVKRIGDNKIIGTLRWYKEAGEDYFYLSDKKRLDIYRQISDFVDIIDVEIKSNICDKVCEICKSKKKEIILSYHNFKKTPDINILKKIVKKGKKYQANMIKIATKITTKKHLFTLIEFTYRYSKKTNLIVVPMGGNIYERLIPLVFGSFFTYVHLNKKVAPCQPSYFEISQFIDLMEPKMV